MYLDPFAYYSPLTDIEYMTDVKLLCIERINKFSLETNDWRG